MKPTTKIILGSVFLVGGISAYRKSDNKINIKANDTIGTKTLAFCVIATGAYLIWKGVKA